MAKIYSKKELLEAIKKIDKKRGKAICLTCGDVCDEGSWCYCDDDS